ncbi:MAG: phosphoribosylamine--glycine ligase [Verrucomicrobia bacterium]|nr:MAG: phosphoribosylamine--glycine ligase [Verrucomicrobiota bacterium]
MTSQKRILVIGSGGREHALVWKLSQSPRVSKIYCAPGNSGTATLATNVEIKANALESLKDFALAKQIDFTVVGPDDPLAAGIVDLFRLNGLRIFGPTAHAARLESSKSFAKDFMMRHGIPCAQSRVFSDSKEARSYCDSATYPLVVKADGLALGKGVMIVEDARRARDAIYKLMDERILGSAGSTVVLEEFLEGTECSMHALIDGDSILVFPDAKDHKRIFDGDLGPNTGGMGAVSPCPALDDTLRQQVRTEILERFLKGLRADGIHFNGMFFPGLMLTANGPKVLEFNCRFGDPETQALLRRLKSDLLDLLEACEQGCLASIKPAWDERAAVSLVLASGGYPGNYQKGKEITGIDRASKIDDVVIFHAGTTYEGGRLATNGGRVLSVTAMGAQISDAIEAAYQAADCIQFENQQRRNDLAERCTTRW